MNPSNFTTYPWSSVLQNSECETVAQNVMKILKRTGDTFRPLTWVEYREERLKDGHFSEMESTCFDRVILYCKSSDTAILFSPSWNPKKDI